MVYNGIRLKIQLISESKNLSTKILRDSHYTNFWYYLDLNKFDLVEQIKFDLNEKIFLPNANFNYKSMRILIDNYEVPSFESTNIFRDNDIIFLVLDQNEPQKEPVVERQVQITKPFEAALIGTSMVKHIDPSKIFEDKKCFFKSISGGRISDIIEFVKKREGFFSQCKYICITCGSNDCDSYNEIKQTIDRYLELAQYLHKTYPESLLIFNQLIPRTKTKYVDLDLFEKRRVCFNDFLNTTLRILIPCEIVEHKSFEDKSQLETLLIDGVHMTPIKGVPIYIDDIKNYLRSNKSLE
ncbi:unnamed protein product [Brachionus calyciflorus]|uniref:SGNH hydrolase-type esterase domain-containing protein n=1 Tax=Brachionus calyciflorus TaxID=104777 RepID=A0A814C315_9BILA|nr:unnamed protein product [Brachionus calyciflorus]